MLIVVENALRVLAVQKECMLNDVRLVLTCSHTDNFFIFIQMLWCKSQKCHIKTYKHLSVTAGQLTRGYTSVSGKGWVLTILCVVVEVL